MKLAKITILVAILFFLVTFYSSLYAIPGDLDKTFDADGKTTTSIGVYDEARDVAIQPDGKIVVVGFNDDGIGPFDLTFRLLVLTRTARWIRHLGRAERLFCLKAAFRRCSV